MQPNKKSKYLRALVLSALVCLMGAVQAEADACNAYLFPHAVTEVVLATVKADRLPILRDVDGCPAALATCATKSYLVRGNQVLVSGAHGAYRCIAYANGRRQTTGWVANDDLTLVPDRAPEGDWPDAWRRVQGDATVTIRKRADKYIASGLATYAVSPGNVRTGVAQGTLHVLPSASGTLARFGSTGDDPTSTCVVTIKRVGPWLVMNDGATDDANSNCGGMGVTFNGIYQRTQHAAGAKQAP